MALRSNGTLSQLIFEQDMRDIGIDNPKISDQQREVLEEACKQGESYKKDFFLFGNTGAGKTVIGQRLLNIWTSQLDLGSTTGCLEKSSFST